MQAHRYADTFIVTGIQVYSTGIEVYVKVILTCCDSAYPFTAVVPYPVVCIYIYLPCVAVMLDRWSNSPVTVYRHARNSPLL